MPGPPAAPDPPEPGAAPAQLAVVVPVRDGRRTLERLLASVRREAPPALALETVVVDDASSADLSESCARFGARLVRLDRPRGPACARNEGVRHSRAPLLLLLDADVVCPAGLFKAIEAALARRPDAVALSFLDPPFAPGAGLVANFLAALEHHWLSWYLVAPGEPSPLPGVTTRCTLVRRDAFDAIGGFDERFSTNAIEDFDFGRRIAAHGPSLLLPAPWVPHRFPRRLTRLVRNYWVRTSIFVGYYLRARPVLHPVQVAAPEAALRLLGTAAWVCAAVAASGGRGWIVAAAALAGGYAWSIRSFLAAALRWSGSARFLLGAFALHFASSPLIVTAALWGLLRALPAVAGRRVAGAAPEGSRA